MSSNLIGSANDEWKLEFYKHNIEKYNHWFIIHASCYMKPYASVNCQYCGKTPPQQIKDNCEFLNKLLKYGR